MLNINLRELVLNAGNCSFSRRKLVLLGRIGSFQLRNWFHGNVSYSRRNERCIPLLEGTDAMKFFAVHFRDKTIPFNVGGTVPVHQFKILPDVVLNISIVQFIQYYWVERFAEGRCCVKELVEGNLVVCNCRSTFI